jgi:transposase
MSLRPKGLTQIPAETSRIARTVFPKGCLAMRARDALGPLFTDEQFAELFAARGRPAWSPARLALVLVLVLQFVEGLTDRQAADAVRARLDWKYALGLDLDDPGFDASVLERVPRAAARRWPGRAAAGAAACSAAGTRPAG